MSSYKHILSLLVASIISVLVFIWIQKPGSVNMLLYTFYLLTDLEESPIINYSFYTIITGLFFWISISFLNNTILKENEDRHF
ncbi:MAG: hypothetical protein BalsKO_05410 [Balneolaceae bacterium]